MSFFILFYFNVNVGDSLHCFAIVEIEIAAIADKY